MSGKPGRSGRRPLTDEQRKFRVIDRAWQILEKSIGKKSDVPIARQISIAKEVVLKDITARLNDKGLINKDTKIIIIKQTGPGEPMTNTINIRPFKDIQPEPGPLGQLAGAQGGAPVEGGGGPQADGGPQGEQE